MTVNADRSVGFAKHVVRRAFDSVLCFTIFCGPTLWTPPGANAQSEQATPSESTNSKEEPNHQRIYREYLIKAAIVFNLAKYTTWPDSAFGSPNSKLRLCVIGVDPFGVALGSIEGKRIVDRQIFIAIIDDPQNALACHILWVSDAEMERLNDILAVVARRPVLTVSDMPEFALSGGIVGLININDRSHIQVNITAADQAGLKLSSKLLRLAEIVGEQFVQPTDKPR